MIVFITYYLLIDFLINGLVYFIKSQKIAKVEAHHSFLKPTLVIQNQTILKFNNIKRDTASVPYFSFPKIPSFVYKSL